MDLRSIRVKIMLIGSLSSLLLMILALVTSYLLYYKGTKNEYLNNIDSVIDQMRYDLNEDFFMNVYNEINTTFGGLICSNYNVNTLDSNYLVIYKVFLTICLNHEFDKDRFQTIVYNDAYIDNFVRRVDILIIPFEI